MQKRNIDVLWLCKPTRKGKIVCKMNDCKVTFWSFVQSEHAAQRIGLIRNSSTENHAKRYELVSPRITVVRMKVSIKRLLIIIRWMRSEMN